MVVAAGSPDNACEWEVTIAVFSVVLLPYAVVGPYSTRVSEASLVVQVMLAPLALIPDACTAEIRGALRSFATVTAIVVEVVALPAASRATAVRLCEPLAVLSVFQVTV